MDISLYLQQHFRQFNNEHESSKFLFLEIVHSHLFVAIRQVRRINVGSCQLSLESGTK